MNGKTAVHPGTKRTIFGSKVPDKKDFMSECYPISA